MHRAVGLVVLISSILLVLVIGVSAAGMLVAVVQSPAPTPADAPTPRLSPNASPSPVRPDPSLTASIPATVDASGTTDVTAELQAVIDEAPDGSSLRFEIGARYRIEGSLLIAGRRDLTLDGRGATLIARQLTEDPERAHVRIVSSERVVVRDIAIIGANPDPGTFRAGFEWQHGVSIQGGHQITLERVSIDRPMGDCVYIANDTQAWAAAVTIVDTSCQGAARQGIAVVGGRSIVVERSTFGSIGLSVLDLEPAAGGPVPQGAHGIVFRDNVVDGPVGEKLLNATGVGQISDVLVQDTRVSGARWGIATQVAPHAGSPRYQDVVFRGNTAEGAFVGRGHAVLFFGDVDGLVVEANRQRIDHAYSAITLVRVCNVTLRDNELGPFDYVDVQPGTCA
jgi:hypothetical protein